MTVSNACYGGITGIDNHVKTGIHDYADEFEYLTNSGIALAVQAISNPRFPPLESENKNLLKLYMND